MPENQDTAIEQEIQAKGKTAPRITPDHIESVISIENYFTAADGVVGSSGDTCVYPTALCLLTFCVLTLNNGFTVTGESACASPENFDAEIGRKIARANAVNKIWLLEGYLLKQMLYQAEQKMNETFMDRLQLEANELKAKMDGLDAFIKNSPVYPTLSDAQRDLLVVQHCAMKEYAATLDQRIALLTTAIIG
ncbi:Gp49 family protein [Deefgea sp. CFH1-16]|uniref:Gp49 family protein n=1 Tax=Deefgea sp. CFH1-16 TaxID=2675457 RepID=UPI0015F5BD44|nr:Gp49 family protein [Deefgea sp. CFH1-16]MBM5575826.1 hypothetical protein [Deefgea sp. CFH1-16]